MTDVESIINMLGNECNYSIDNAINMPIIKLSYSVGNHICKLIERLGAELEAAERDLTSLATGTDECLLCEHCREEDAKCEAYDYDCALCGFEQCVCASCGSYKNSKFKWRRLRDEDSKI